MYVRTARNGKVQYVEKYRDPMTEKWKQATVTMPKDTAANRRIALEELTKKIQSASQTATNEPYTLKMILDSYLDYQKQTVKPSTYDRNKRTLVRLVEKIGNDCIADKLTAAYITDRILEMKVSPTTANEYIKRLKAMLNWAYVKDYIDNRKCMDKLKPLKETKTKRERIEDKYLEPDELNKMLEYMKTTKHWDWYYLTKFLVLTGLRFGEAIALTSNDVSDSYITVNKTYDSINDVTTTPKTIASNRDVFIQKELKDVLKQYRIWRRQTDMSNGYRSDLLFHPNGERVNYYSYNKYVREVALHVLGRTNVTTHIFRHTHASLLLAENIDIEMIARRLGHDNSRVTRDIYLHVVEKLKERDNERIANIKIL